MLSAAIKSHETLSTDVWPPMLPIGPLLATFDTCGPFVRILFRSGSVDARCECGNGLGCAVALFATIPPSNRPAPTLAPEPDVSELPAPTPLLFRRTLGGTGLHTLHPRGYRNRLFKSVGQNSSRSFSSPHTAQGNFLAAACMRALSLRSFIAGVRCPWPTPRSQGIRGWHALHEICCSRLSRTGS